MEATVNKDKDKTKSPISRSACAGLHVKMILLGILTQKATNNRKDNINSARKIKHKNCSLRSAKHDLICRLRGKLVTM